MNRFYVESTGFPHLGSSTVPVLLIPKTLSESCYGRDVMYNLDYQIKKKWPQKWCNWSVW